MDVPAVDDPRVQVVIPVPVKGVVLRLPRFDFIDEVTYDEMMAEIDAIDSALVPRKQARAARLLMLKRFVPAKDYKVCEGLTIGQLDAIALEWREKSSISLGEYVASATSSPANTEAPSNTISTSEDGPAATSDAA